MLTLLSVWDSSFSVQAVADVVGAIVSGFLLGGVFWVVGYVVDFLMTVMRGGFFWMR